MGILSTLKSGYDYVVDKTSDGMLWTDRKIRAGLNEVEELYDGAVDAVKRQATGWAIGKTPPRYNEAPSSWLDKYENNKLADSLAIPACGVAIDLMIDGKNAYPQLKEGLKNAKSEILMEYYSISGKSQITQEIVDILKQKIQEGVKVRLLYDWFGNKSADIRLLKELEAAGAEVKRHGGWSKQAIVSDHRKLTVVDGQTAFTGGMNIGDHYNEEYHDVMVKVDGPVVANMRNAFAVNWFEATGNKLPQMAAPAAKGSYCAQVLASDTKRHPMREALYQQVDNAKDRIWMEMAYLTDDKLVAKLKAAAKRGVDVRIITAEKTDEKQIQLLHQASLSEWTKAGIKVYLMPGMVHTKVTVVDGKWAAVGSTNATYRALSFNDELSLAVMSPDFAKQMEERLLKEDMTKANEVNRSYLKRHDMGRIESVKAKVYEWVDELF